MTRETAFKVIEGCSEYDSVGIIFFGGEPLLCKDLIKEIIDYSKKIDCVFNFKMTTNGLLLDDETISFCKENHIIVSLSIDGIKSAHDKHRKDFDGQPTYDKVVKVAGKLLLAMPYSTAMMTVNPDTVEYYCDSVKYLFELGFHYLICTLNYQADWNEKDMKVLKSEYEKLAKLYINWTEEEEKFYFSPFDAKISSHIMGEEYCKERCQLGKKQISVSPGGGLYPCIQFVNRSEYLIGNVETGIEKSLQSQLYEKNSKEAETCTDCAIRKRCNHNCGCINIAATGNINKVSPVVCHNEQIILPIADSIAENLYKKRNGMFIQKQYNEMYSFISLIEDNSEANK
jgi:uncharacterized protein